MNFLRSSGILLHVTSLPSRGGIGDLGPAAQEFVEFLSRTGQTWWQMLPVGPTGYGNSPYQLLSSFAGNPLLVSPERLRDAGLLDEGDLVNLPGATDRVDFEAVKPLRMALLKKAFERFRDSESAVASQRRQQWRDEHAWWLDDYCLFAAAGQAHGERVWTEWDPALARREPAALEEWRAQLADAIEFESFVQFQFEQQWLALHSFARERGVRLIGDVPIFIAHDSADVWANQSLFALDDAGGPTLVAGVPPDYFSTLGQRWGNPLYRWDKHAATGYAWWTARLRRAFAQFDVVRIDHFRGFESNWEIAAEKPDARDGRWVPGPGTALFRAVERALGSLPVIAEDLGVITPPVEALRDALGYPGMRVLQFAFGDDPKGIDYQPHNFVRNCFAYTGTHDNDTTVGWFNSKAGAGTTRTAEQVEREQTMALRYVNGTAATIHWDMIRAAWSSVADVAVAPLQDVLGLGSEARMNMPGSREGNWVWRCLDGALTPEVEERLAELTVLYGRVTAPRPWYFPK